MISPEIAERMSEPIEHAGDSKVAHCKLCEKALLAITARNARRARR